VLGILYTAWMIRTSQLYLQEADQKLNLNLARHLAAERILMPEGRIDKAAPAGGPYRRRRRSTATFTSSWLARIPCQRLNW